MAINNDWTTAPIPIIHPIIQIESVINLFNNVSVVHLHLIYTPIGNQNYNTEPESPPINDNNTAKSGITTAINEIRTV